MAATSKNKRDEKKKIKYGQSAQVTIGPALLVFYSNIYKEYTNC
jgi:hypothetical protein